MLAFIHTVYSDGSRGSVPAESGCQKIYSDLQQYKNSLACINMSSGSAGNHPTGAFGRYN